MLKTKLEAFYALVEEARAVVGESPARIADYVTADSFPNSYDASLSEGCDDMLRGGVIEAVKRYIVKPKKDTRQMHMNDIEPDVLPYVETLNRTSFLVPSDKGAEMDEDTKTLGFYVPISDLVNDLDALRKAVSFMENKTAQVQSETDKLRLLLTYLEHR